MYEGTNATAQTSMDAIADAFLALLATDSFDAITVKEICASAERSRQTFYQLFSSKDEVLAWRFRQLFEEFEQSLPTGPDLRTLALAYFVFWRTHAAFLSALADNRLYGLLGDSFRSFLPQIAGFAEATSALPHPTYVTAGVAGLLANLLLEWRSQGFIANEVDLADLLVAILDGSYFKRL